MKRNTDYLKILKVAADLNRRESCSTVVHINMAQPMPVAEATLDMIEIMTRAFDESEGGEGEEPGEPVNWHIGVQFKKWIPGWFGMNYILCCDETHVFRCRESSMDCRPEEPPAF